MASAPIVAMLIRKFSSKTLPLIIFLQAFNNTSPLATRYAIKKNPIFNSSGFKNTPEINSKRIITAFCGENSFSSSWQS